MYHLHGLRSAIINILISLKIITSIQFKLTSQHARLSPFLSFFFLLRRACPPDCFTTERSTQTRRGVRERWLNERETELSLTHFDKYCCIFAQ